MFNRLVHNFQVHLFPSTKIGKPKIKYKNITSRSKLNGKKEGEKKTLAPEKYSEQEKMKLQQPFGR